MKGQGGDDIRQAARLAALESELRLCREVLAGSADGVLLVDSGLVVRWANEAMASFMGLAAGDLIGRTCHQLFWDGEPCHGCPSREGGGAQEAKEPTAVLTGGRRQCRAVPRTAPGGIVGAVTIRGAGWASPEQGPWTPPELPAEAIPVPCHSLDGEGRVIAVNQAWLALLGYRREEVIGQPFSRFVCPTRQGHFERTFAFLLLRGEISGVETEVCRKDGKVVPLLVDSRGSFDEEGSFRRSTCILTPRPGDHRSAAGLLPICSSCKKIRDKGGLWHNLEYYLNIHRQIEFSHGICPDCLPKLYPEFYG